MDDDPGRPSTLLSPVEATPNVADIDVATEGDASRQPLQHFGVSEFTTWPWPFERDVERYAENGIAGIEVCEFKLGRRRCAQQLASVAQAGLTVTSVQSTVHSIFPDSLAPQPTDSGEREHAICDAIARIAPHVPAGTPFIVITGVAPKQNVRFAIDHCAKALERIATFAAGHGVRIAFEPLNPVLFNTDTALWGLGRARELIERVGHPSLGLCIDTWNIFQTPDLAAELRRCVKDTFIVQVSQWQEPRSGADRRNLGDGTIDTAGILHELRSAGYSGWCALEIFSDTSLSDSLWAGDLDAVLRDNRNVFSRVWEESAP